VNKRILFLCGSPRGKKSASLYTARYLAKFLDHDYEFLDVASARLSNAPTEAEPAFLKVVDKIQAADALIWTFGAWTWFVPLEIQYLFDKLFAQDGHEFTDKIAASLMTSVRVHDDSILDRVRFVSEQLGFGYIGDVSAVGNPFFGYVEDEEVTEDSCRMLAGQINRALSDGYVPAKRYQAVDHKFLSPTFRGEGFATGPTVSKSGDKTILVLTGNRLSEDLANASIADAIQGYSKNIVEVIALQDHNVRPCNGCILCDFKVEGVCVLKDEYEEIKGRLQRADGMVYIGTCASSMVDSNLKAFLDRCWGIGHRPTLSGKYGFSVATGGGPLEADAAEYLQGLMNKTGARCIAALARAAGETEEFAITLRQTIEDLDRAMEEKWRIADRFRTRSVEWVFRDLAATNGMMLRADYKFHKENGMFDYASPGGGNTVLRMLYKSKKLEKKLIPMKQAQSEKARSKRLDLHLQHGGRLGVGKEVTEDSG
jgi:multimeric flavodoxin WrbA